MKLVLTGPSEADLTAWWGMEASWFVVKHVARASAKYGEKSTILTVLFETL